MIVELHNDDGTKTTYFGVSDFSRYDSRSKRVTQLHLNNSIEADYNDREFHHDGANIHSIVSEGVLNEEGVYEHIGDRLVEPGHEIVVGIPAVSSNVAYALAELRREADIDAEDNLTVVGEPDPEWPANDTSEVDDG
jgi:hypothetical protein